MDLNVKVLLSLPQLCCETVQLGCQHQLRTSGAGAADAAAANVAGAAAAAAGVAAVDGDRQMLQDWMLPLLPAVAAAA